MVTIRIGETSEDLSWEQWERRVRDGRIPETTLVRFEPVTGDAFVPAGELDLYTSLRDDARRAWSDRYRSGPPPWMTALLAGSQIRLWWLIVTGGATTAVLADRALLSHARVLEDGEVWRLVTMGFLHVAPLHILANLAMFLFVGWNLERAIGRLNLLAIFVGSVVGGSVASLLAKPGVVSLGASGGVLGIVAAATVFGFVRHSLLSERARVGFGWALFPYLALVYLLGWTNENTDNWAHTGGLVTGALLALLLDPPGLERRRHWGWGAPAGVGVACALALGAMGWIGPAAIPLDDVAARVPDADARRAHREFEWDAPVSWQRGFIGGRSGFVSKASPTRGWAVRQRELGAYETVDALAERIAADIAREHGAAARVQPISPAELAGRPARRVAAEIDGQPPLYVEYHVAVRGLYALDALWSVEQPVRSRLDGLRARALASVRWNDPTPLVEARAELRRKPRSRAARRQLAEALGMAGDVDEARALWETLVAEQPALADGWAGLLAHEGRVGGFEAPPVETWRRALAASTDPAVHAEVALSMHAHGEVATAVGVLELSWAMTPGDRTLRRARRMVGLPVALVDATPEHLLRDPVTGAALRAPRLLPPDRVLLDSAIAAGEAWQATRDALSAEVMEGPDLARLGALLLLHRGMLPPPDELAGALAYAVEDLRGAGRGVEARWLPDDLTRWARSRHAAEPAWADGWIALAAAAGADDPDARPPLASLGLAVVSTPAGELLVRTVARGAEPP